MQQPVFRHETWSSGGADGVHEPGGCGGDGGGMHSWKVHPRQSFTLQVYLLHQLMHAWPFGVGPRPSHPYSMPQSVHPSTLHDWPEQNDAQRTGFPVTARARQSARAVRSLAAMVLYTVPEVPGGRRSARLLGAEFAELFRFVSFRLRCAKSRRPSCAKPRYAFVSTSPRFSSAEKLGPAPGAYDPRFKYNATTQRYSVRRL